MDLSNLKDNKTKIVCTLGPSTGSKERIRALIDAGMDVVRLNFSHGSHEEHAERLRIIREAASEAGQHLPVVQDLSGPKIRTGALASGPVELTDGERYLLTSRPIAGNDSGVSMNYAGLAEDVEPGDPILLADGALELRVLSVEGPDILCEVVHGGTLGDHKGINVPTKPLRVPALTDKDKADLRFGLQQGVDWVALSFVRSAEDLTEIKAIIKRESPRPVPVIAKIEKRAALDNLDVILMDADGVMVARGDLGVEIPMEEIPGAQKEIIEKANATGIPVITATQMLESMIRNPRPTRAEMTDIANAIFDGTDAIMLSGETAIGDFPIEAVRTMVKIANATTRGSRYKTAMARRGLRSSSDIPGAISYTACDLAEAISAEAIICCTRSGRTAQLVAQQRPPMPIFAVSPHVHVLRQLNLYWGIIPLAIAEAGNTDDMIDKAKRALLDSGLGRHSDQVVIVAGIPLEVEGSTNMVKADVL